MPFKRLVGEIKGIRDGFEKKWRRKGERKRVIGRGRSYIAPEGYISPLALVEERQWANLPHELLVDIIGRVEASETSWPGLRDVVSCGTVCRSWRETTKEVVRTPEQCGLLTFPMSLKQPGPRGFPIQCFIKRDMATSMYRLYLGLSPALAGDASKLLLVAKKIRRATRMEFVISLVANDFSRASNTNVGKLRSNILGTKFVVYDNQPPCNLVVQSNRKANKKKASSRVPIGNCKVATISYELNVLRTRGPRRIQCTMHWVPLSAIQEGGTAPTPATFGNSLEQKFSPLSDSKGKYIEYSSTALAEPLERTHKMGDPLVLKNKVPRWHEQLQCWCLNFKGRVTVASVKNFQLVASVSPSHNVAAAEQEKVILQFGKIAKDIFTMDYRYPLSAFQAFAICLSSFDTKPACE